MLDHTCPKKKSWLLPFLNNPPITSHGIGDQIIPQYDCLREFWVRTKISPDMGSALKSLIP